MSPGMVEAARQKRNVPVLKVDTHSVYCNRLYMETRHPRALDVPCKHCIGQCIKTFGDSALVPALSQFSVFED